MKTAFVFPGQGSQKVGMGMDLFESFPVFKSVFSEVSDAVHRDITKISLYGPESEINKTENAQVALMAMSVGIFRILKQELGGCLNISFVAGHSLGEYAALVCSGAFELSDMALFLDERGRAMTNAVQEGIGGMAVILGLSKDKIEEIVKQSTLSDGDMCCIANDNCPGQIVLSGHLTALKRAEEFSTIAGAKRFLILPVSVPAHSPLMRNAIDIWKPKIDSLKLSSPTIPFVSNYSIAVENKEDIIKSHLLQQMVLGVRWIDCVNYMINEGVNSFVEIGAGMVLSGLIKKIVNSDSIEIKSINNSEGVSNYVRSYR